MNLFEVIILGIVEGLTEFLPISSTGHLILTSNFLHLENTEFLKTFNVFIQIGAISAILKLYFRELLTRKKWLIELGVGFLPLGIMGLLFGSKIREALFSPILVCISLIVGGLFLIYLDSFYEKQRGYKRLKLIDHVKIGFFQCLALIPGFSRSTSCLVGAMATGTPKKEAIKLTFLYGLPSLYAASLYSVYKLDLRSITSTEYLYLFVGAITAFITSYFTVRFFLSFLEKKVFRFLGIYRIILAIVLLVLNSFSLINFY